MAVLLLILAVAVEEAQLTGEKTVTDTSMSWRKVSTVSAFTCDQFHVTGCV